MIVKVCGMRDAENIREVEQSGVDWMGFIFVEHSPRFVYKQPDYLPSQIHRVGVFVNASDDYIDSIHRQYGLDYIQLHGHETPDDCQRLQARGYRLIKAIAPRSIADFKRAASYAPFIDFLLFDTPCVELGGSGKRFNWKLLQDYHGQTPFLLSGGIRPAHLAELNDFKHPQWVGVDVNSGFESAPGIKDAEQLKAFVKPFKTKNL